MADAIELYLDLSTPQGALVKGLSDRSAAVLGPFYQGSALNLRVFPVVSNGRTVAGPFFDRVALDNLDFELVLGPRAGVTLATSPSGTAPPAGIGTRMSFAIAPGLSRRSRG